MTYVSGRDRWLLYSDRRRHYPSSPTFKFTLFYQVSFTDLVCLYTLRSGSSYVFRLRFRSRQERSCETTTDFSQRFNPKFPLLDPNRSHSPSCSVHLYPYFLNYRGLTRPYLSDTSTPHDFLELLCPDPYPSTSLPYLRPDCSKTEFYFSITY